MDKMRVNRLFFGLIFIFCGLSGCAEETYFIDPNDKYQVIPLSMDGADCVAGDVCRNAFLEDRDFYRAPFEGNLMSDDAYEHGYFGYIDAGCHEIRSSKGSADVDVIGVRAKVGTPIQVNVVTASQNNRLNPVVYLLSDRGEDLIYSTNPGRSGAASMWFLAPTNPFYLSIEAGENYSIHSPTCEDGVTYRGGEAYGYAAKIVTLDRGELVSSFGVISNAKVHYQKMPSSGRAQYFKAKVGEGKSLSVALESSLGYPVMSPIDRSAGAYVWTKAGTALSKTFDESTRRGEIVIGAEQADEGGYLWFVVTDYQAGSGYTYSIKVTPEP